MSMTPWEPFDEFRGVTTLRDALNRLFEDSVLQPARLAVLGRTFPLDLRETDLEYVVEAALPGFTPDQVKVTATEDTVTIRASKTTEENITPQGKNGQRSTEGKIVTEKPGVYVRRERYTGEMVRVIDLPTPIDPNRVMASYENGELKLTLPKAPHAQPKQIPIQVKELPKETAATQ